MEEGKIATAWAQFDWKKSITYLWSNTLYSVVLDQQPFGEPASRFTSAIERSGIWKKEIATATVCATEKSINIRMCATLE
jgi:hypothetical protein